MPAGRRFEFRDAVTLSCLLALLIDRLCRKFRRIVASYSIVPFASPYYEVFHNILRMYIIQKARHIFSRRKENCESRSYSSMLNMLNNRWSMIYRRANVQRTREISGFRRVLRDLKKASNERYFRQFDHHPKPSNVRSIKLLDGTIIGLRTLTCS